MNDQRQMETFELDSSIHGYHVYFEVLHGMPSTVESACSSNTILAHVPPDSRSVLVREFCISTITSLCRLWLFWLLLDASIGLLNCLLWQCPWEQPIGMGQTARHWLRVLVERHNKLTRGVWYVWKFCKSIFFSLSTNVKTAKIHPPLCENIPLYSSLHAMFIRRTSISFQEIDVYTDLG